MFSSATRQSVHLRRECPLFHSLPSLFTLSSPHSYLQERRKGVAVGLIALGEDQRGAREEAVGIGVAEELGHASVGVELVGAPSLGLG